MKKQIDRFLLGLLWLLAFALGASFWFNTKFGFNIFTIKHWRYLGQLQASDTAIAPSFYISMIIIVFVMTGGLYLIARPRFRKITLASKTLAADGKQPVGHCAAESEKKAPEAAWAGPAFARPPRLKMPIQNGYVAAHNANNSPVPAAGPAISATAEIPESFAYIGQIFESAGYKVKKPPRIGGFRPALFAIGSDEILWIGAVGTEPSKLSEAADKLGNLFTETLEDIRIDIRAFVINPKPDNAPNSIEIEKFDSVDALRDYMGAHPNRELPEEEKEDFDAYSEYIDTAADYFNKS
ncbi:MAG: hypothetical protein LBF28_01140 [Rickettsiales bacterium]|jgi:hypothetical protein|nr:hypothetical protein [Rickettsiales bacterium]